MGEEGPKGKGKKKGKEGKKGLDKPQIGAVVYAATRNLYKHLPGAVASLLEYNDPERVYLLIEDDALPAEFSVPDCCVCINALPLRDKYVDPNGVNRHGMFSWQALLRVAYGEIFSEDIILSLDVDTIVCDSLLPIFEADLTDKWFAMVREKEVPQYRRQAYYPKYATYCNCGVCLFNLKQIRADNMFPVFYNMINTVRMDYCEQDTFNNFGMMHDKIVFLPLRYNNCIGCGYCERPAIQHYAGVMNKWEPGANFYRKEYMTKWHKYL